MNPFSSGGSNPFGGGAPPRLSPRGVARLAALLALVLVVVVAFRAGSAHRVASAAPGVAPLPHADEVTGEGARASGVEAPLDPGVLEQAARQAPFHPEREAPAGRYQLLSDRRAEVPPPPPEVIREEAPIPAFQLHGVVATAGEGTHLVILSVDGNAPMVLSEGDEMAGYRVAQVVGTSALLTGNGRNLRVSVADPSPEGAAVVQETATGRAPPRGNTPAQQRQALQQQQALQRLVETRARELQQQLGGQGTVRVEGDRVIVTTPDGRNMMIERVSPPPPRPGGGE